MIAQILGDAIVLDDGQGLHFLPIVSESDLARAADTLNWFDKKGRLVIGSKNNPAHVAAWREWHERSGLVFLIETNR